MNKRTLVAKMTKENLKMKTVTLMTTTTRTMGVLSTELRHCSHWSCALLFWQCRGSPTPDDCAY